MFLTSSRWFLVLGICFVVKLRYTPDVLFGFGGFRVVQRSTTRSSVNINVKRRGGGCGLRVPDVRRGAYDVIV
jgi:hypothetical protein